MYWNIYSMCENLFATFGAGRFICIFWVCLISLVKGRYCFFFGVKDGLSRSGALKEY